MTIQELPWLVRAQYTFLDRGASIDEIDRVVGGRVKHAGGGVRHMLGVGDGPWHTSLEWEFDSLEEARMALLRLADMRVIGDARLAGAERFLGPDELRVRRNDAAAGRARCVFCRARIPADEETEMSLQGVAVGGLATLTCRACGLAMEWTIAPEDREA